MSSSSTCGICASILTTDPAGFDTETEKPVRNKTLTCCGRTICADCICRQPRFDTYCPYCQQTRLPLSKQTAPPPADTKPPPYTELASEPPPPLASTSTHTPPPAPIPAPAHLAAPPPSYTSRASSTPPPQQDVLQQDILHYVRPHETLLSLSLAYHLPLPLLRARNNITSDHLLQARRTIYIPPPYRGPSLSAEPAEGFEESERKARVRRFMVRTKCADWKMAETYVGNAEGDLEGAVGRWDEDEVWVRENPRGERGGFGGWLRGQMFL